MLFIVTCVDKPRSLDVRLTNRPAHLAWLEGLGAKLKVGGAMLAGDGQTPIGSMLIVEGDSEAGVRAILADDPYALAGLFESVTLKPWRQGAGQKIL